MFFEYRWVRRNDARAAISGAATSPLLDTLHRGVQWIGGAVDWGSII